MNGVGLPALSKERSVMCTRSLGFINMNNPIRNLLLKLTVDKGKWSTIWSIFISSTIFVNSFFLCLIDPVIDNAPINIFIEGLEIYFLIIFTVEFFVKLIAMGALFESCDYMDNLIIRGGATGGKDITANKNQIDVDNGKKNIDKNVAKRIKKQKFKSHTYFRDYWNLLDFFIIVSSYVGLALRASGNNINTTALRTLRILRPLRTLKLIPGLQVVIAAFFSSMSQLFSVLVLAFLVLGTYALIGTQLFSGVLHQRCMLPDGTILPSDDENDRYCSFFKGFGRQCDVNSEAHCSIHPENPNSNVTSFDNFGVALLAIFQSVTLEGWTDIMYWTSDSTPGFAEVYFVSLIVFGSFFVMNVISATIAVNYAAQSKLEKLRRKIDRDNNRVALAMQQQQQQQNGQDPSQQTINEKVVLDVPTGFKDRIEMRLMYSYEVFGKDDGYHIIDEEMYSAFWLKHRGRYEKWKKLMEPVLEKHLPPGVKAAARSRNRGSVAAIDVVGNVVSTFQTFGKNTANQFERDNLEENEEMRDDNDEEVSQKTSMSIRNDVLNVTVRGIPDSQGQVDGDPIDNRNGQESPDPFEAFRVKLEETLKRWREIIIEKMGMCMSLDGVDEGSKEDAFFLRKNVYAMIQSKYFERFIISIILANTLVLGMNHYPMAPSFDNALDGLNVLFAIVFTFEMVMKLYGLGVYVYFSDAFNRFDCFVVIVSLLTFMIPSQYISGAALTVFRIFRIMRVLRLAKSWKGMQKILIAMGHTLKTVVPLVILLFIVLYIFTVSGMFLFGGEFELDEDERDCTESYYHYPHCPPRSNFDTFFWGFVTCFQIITGENWNELMYYAIASTSWASIIYFIIVIFIGNIIVLNLFLGACIDGFMSGAIGDDEGEEKEEEGDDDEEEEEEDEINRLPEDNAQALREALEAAKKRYKTVSKFEEHPSYPHKVLCNISSSNCIRSRVGAIVLSAPFSWFITTIIFISCIVLMFESPLSPPPVLESTHVIDIIITVIFTLECLMKIMAFGFAHNPGAYLRDNWNILDFILVILGIVGIFLHTISAFKGFRALRALRPLRLVRRIESLRVATLSLLKVVQPASNVAAFCVLFFYISAIVGVETFGGRFYACYDLMGEGNDTTYERNFGEDICYPAPNYTASDFCLEGNINRCNGTWENPTYEGSGSKYHFDNIFTGMLTLFEVSSLELWLDVMASSTDMKGIGMNPVRGSSDAFALFYIFFIIFAKLFLLQLFVAVVVDTFIETYDDAQGNSILTDAQKNWIHLHRIARITNIPWKPKPLKNDQMFYWFRTQCRVLCLSEEFEFVILLVILANSVVLMFKHFNPEPWFVSFQLIMEYVFGLIYVLEMLVKMIAFGIFGPYGYFSRKRNWFDFLIVVALVAGWINDSQSFQLKALLSAVVSLRALRTLRLFTLSRAIREITDTALNSLPALGNISLLLILILFVFAVVGVSIFGELRYQDPPLSFTFVNDYANFDNFINAALTLFRGATGESWNGIMHDMGQFSWFAYPFWIVYVLLVQFCMINLFVAVLLNDLEELLERNATEKQMSILLKKNHDHSKKKVRRTQVEIIQMFAKAWAEVRLIFEIHLKREQSRLAAQMNKQNDGSKNNPLSFFTQATVADGSTSPTNNSTRNFGLPLDNDPLSSSPPPTLRFAPSAAALPPTNNKFSFKSAGALGLSGNVVKKAWGLVSEADSLHPSLTLPVLYFPKLLERLEHPFGISGVLAGATRSELLLLYKAFDDLPVTDDGFILYHSTLQCLIDHYALVNTIDKWTKGLHKHNMDAAFVLQKNKTLEEFLKYRVPGVFEWKYDMAPRTLVQYVVFDRIKKFAQKWIVRWRKRRNKIKNKRKLEGQISVRISSGFF